MPDLILSAIALLCGMLIYVLEYIDRRMFNDDNGWCVA